jgi:thiol-disulfide isomerase/thioredoxin
LELVLRLLISGLLAACALTAAGCDRQSDPVSQPEPTAAGAPAAADASGGEEPAGKLDISKRGEAMPDVTFEAPDGTPVKLSDFRGKPLLVNLWATWCGPCVAEMPTLDALAVQRGPALKVLVVSQDGERAKVDAWWAKQSYRLLEPYLDRKSDLGFAFGTGMVPTTVLYDADGREVWRVIGGMDWNGPRANTLLAETLGSAG